MLAAALLLAAVIDHPTQAQRRAEIAERIEELQALPPPVPACWHF
jgi:hypothetical protein